MPEITPQPLEIAAAGLTLRLLPRTAYAVKYTPRQPVAGFAFENQRGEHAFASDWVRPFHAMANGLAFTPAGCSIYSEARTGGEYLTLTGEPGRLAALLGDEQGALPEHRFTGRVHERGIGAAHALRRMLLTGNADAAALESAVSAFLDAIAEAGGAAWRRPPSAASLTARRLKIVEELIAARLAGPLSIGEMAAACGLSSGFFLRAFKAATGQAPHQFLLARRLIEARRLLEQTGAGTAEIAALTGFCSQAHMTTAFRRALGVTPAAYRAAIANRV
jgi:AraC family transcriptional regulator